MINQSHLYKEHEIKYGNGEKDYNIYHIKANEIEGWYQVQLTLRVSLY